MEQHANHTPSSLRFVRCLRAAVARLLRDPATPWLIVMTLVIAAPLYLAGYHAGRHPLAGFALSLLLGAVALTVAVTWPDRGRPSGARLWEAVHRVLRDAGVPLAAFALVVAGAVWLWNLTWGAAMPPPVIELVTNTATFPWKPLVHVVLGSLLAFMSAPAAFLGVAAAEDDQPIADSVVARHETPRHSVLPMIGLLALWSACLVLAHVPVLGLLLVPVLGRAIRLYACGPRTRSRGGSGPDGGPPVAP